MLLIFLFSFAPSGICVSVIDFIFAICHQPGLHVESKKQKTKKNKKGASGDYELCSESWTSVLWNTHGWKLVWKPCLERSINETQVFNPISFIIYFVCQLSKFGSVSSSFILLFIFYDSVYSSPKTLKLSAQLNQAPCFTWIYISGVYRFPRSVSGRHSHVYTIANNLCRGRHTDAHRCTYTGTLLHYHPHTLTHTHTHTLSLSLSLSL